MLKIFKSTKKKLENKIVDYAQRDIDEISRILNRPKEGEIVKLSNIKIPKYLKNPSRWKMAQRRKYYQQYGYFRSPIILDEFGYLVDGHTTYLLAKEMGFDYITILRKW